LLILKLILLKQFTSFIPFFYQYQKSKKSPDEKSFIHIYSFYDMDAYDCEWKFLQSKSFFQLKKPSQTQKDASLSLINQI
jgi:hypothetical protein